MADHIYDPETGRHLAIVREGKVLTGGMKHVANVREGAIYDLEGKFVCHLAPLGAALKEDGASEAFKGLLD